MRSAIQEELFGPEQYTRLCSMCRGEFPRSPEFFPPGTMSGQTGFVLS